MIIEPTVKKMDWGQAQAFLSKEMPDGKKVEAGVFTCEPGQKLQLHAHEGADEYCWVFEGQAIFRIGDQEYQVNPGQVIKIPKDVTHTSFPAGDHSFSSFFIVIP